MVVFLRHHLLEENLLKNAEVSDCKQCRARALNLMAAEGHLQQPACQAVFQMEPVYARHHYVMTGLSVGIVNKLHRARVEHVTYVEILIN